MKSVRVLILAAALTLALATTAMAGPFGPVVPMSAPYGPMVDSAFRVGPNGVWGLSTTGPHGTVTSLLFTRLFARGVITIR